MLSYLQNFFQVDPRLNQVKVWLFLGVALILLVVYFSLTSTAALAMPGNTDKIYHCFSYMCLMGWWLQLFPRALIRLLLAVAFTLLGVGMEVLQSFHPLRYFDVGDMLANSCGVILAWLLGLTAFDQLLYRFENRFINRT